MNIRSFIAIPIAKQLRDELGDAAAQMAYQDKSNAVRWVDQQNYHITLAFLGDQEQPDLEALADQLDRILSSEPFSFTVSHCSPFPESRPKLIAALIDADDALTKLHRQVRSAISDCSLLVDKRRFIPHITLGRYRHSRNRFAGAIPNSLSLVDQVNEVCLYESTLNSAGAEYQVIFRFPFDEFKYDELEYPPIDMKVGRET